MANILYRASTSAATPGATSAKTTPLSNLEIDGNFKSLNDELILKATLASPIFTGTVVLPSTTSIGNVTNIEINYLDGVTGAIQTQLGTKAPSDSPTFTGPVVLPNTTSIGTVTNTEISYLSGVTGAIQTQLGTKAPLASPTFTGTVVLPSTTSIGTVTNTELSYISGVTSAVQTQLGTKAPLASPALTGTPTAPTAVVDTNTTQVATTAFVVAQIADDALAKVIPGSSGNILTSNGSAWVSTTPGPSGATLADDTTTNTTQYIGMSRTTTGAWNSAYVATTKLYFNPSTGTLNSTVFNSLSDRNVKDNIVPIQNAESTVKAIVGVEFNWKDSGRKSAGVIAQDLEKVLPWLVETNSEGTKSVNYAGLTGYLIEAIKELSARIEVLEAK